MIRKNRQKGNTYLKRKKYDNKKYKGTISKVFNEDKRNTNISRIPNIYFKLKIVFILVGINIALVLIYFILSYFAIRNVTVEGNKHYSKSEIQSMVMKGYLGDNSLYLSFKYKNKEIKNIPFIDTMDVTVLSKDAIKIMVYEKALAGYIEYLGRYMYFDNEGVVVEASKIATNGVPRVTGLNVDHVVLYEQLPVENKEVFQKILTITKLLNKYDVICDRIQFDSSFNVVLGYGKVKVNVGKLDNLEEKLMRLPYILPSLENEKGTLDLQNYDSDRKTIPFERDS